MVDMGRTKMPANHVRGTFPLRSYGAYLLGIACMLVPVGCGTPTAKVEVVPPEKPITINLNVKIDHEVRVKVEKELDEVFSKESKLF